MAGMTDEVTRQVAEFVADSVNPFLLGVLLPAPFVGARRAAPWRFYGACALGIGVAVGLAEVGKAREVWAGHPGFPSGHAAFAAAAATCLACRDRRWLAVGLPAVGLMAWALVGARFHTPSDVVGALALGPAVAGACYALTGRTRRDAPGR